MKLLVCPPPLIRLASPVCATLPQATGRWRGSWAGRCISCRRSTSKMTCRFPAQLVCWARQTWRSKGAPAVRVLVPQGACALARQQSYPSRAVLVATVRGAAPWRSRALKAATQTRPISPVHPCALCARWATCARQAQQRRRRAPREATRQRSGALRARSVPPQRTKTS